MSVRSEAELKALQSSSGDNTLFCCTFYGNDDISKNMIEFVGEIKEDYTEEEVHFVSIEEEETAASLFEGFGILSVPTTVIINGSKILARVEGYLPKDLMTAIEKAKKSTTKVSLEDRLKALINKSKIMLFMKGVPDAPRCGFSRQIVALLKDNNIEFGSFDILTDDEVRQGLKTYSDWPTYPQVYAEGELIGGLDILKELVENGELHESLGC